MVDNIQLLKICISVVLNHGGEIRLDKLVSSPKLRKMKATLNEIFRVLLIHEYEWFLLINFDYLDWSQNSDTKVRVVTSLELCGHFSISGKCWPNRSCPHLHMCRKFLLNKCTNRKCKWGRKFHTGHNQKCLQAHGKGLESLEFFSTAQLKALIKSNRSRATVPTVCEQGNSCEDFKSGTCPKVHTCWKWLNSYDYHDGDVCQEPHRINVLEKTLANFGLSNCFEQEDLRNIISWGLKKSYVSTWIWKKVIFDVCNERKLKSEPPTDLSHDIRKYCEDVENLPDMTLSETDLQL